MKHFYFTAILSLMMSIALAQDVPPIRGRVTDQDGKSFGNVSIVLFNMNNKAMQTVVSNEHGDFLLSKPSFQYYLYVSHLGYIPFKGTPKDGEPVYITLRPSPNELKEVTIKATKPFIEQQPDKMVVNVGGDLKAGINAIDILKKLPGVALNKDELSVEGKGISVLIDGKPTKMSGISLITLLENTSTANISQMEIIYNPSAKYDAAGNGGIINISTLKRVLPGYDANASLTMGHGWKYPTMNNAASLNYRTGKNLLVMSYGQGIGRQYQELQVTNRLADLDQLLLDSLTYRTRYQSNNIRIGFDRTFKKNDAFGVLLTGNFNTRKPGLSSITQILSLDGEEHKGKTSSTNPGRILSNGLNLNLNYKHVFSSTHQKEIIIDADAGIFGYENDSENTISETNFLNPSTQHTYSQLGKTTSKIYSLKGDYTQKTKLGTFESGLKLSNVQLENNFSSLFLSNTAVPVDYGSNDFIYKETILAAYVNNRITLGKFTMQIGLRAEQTATNGTSVTLNNEVKRDYLNLFPNISTGVKLKKNSISLAYGRRIGRPLYNELNPFVIVNSAFSSRTGNPYLKPSYTQNLRLAYSYNNKITLSTSYSTTKDVITDFQTRDNQNQVINVLKANVSSYKNIGMSVSYTNTLFKFWQLNYGIGVSNSDYRFDYGNTSQQVKQTTGSLSIGNNFQLNKDFYSEIFFYGQAKATFGTFVNLPFSTTSISMGKKILKGNGNIALNLNDIFFTGITRSFRKYGNFDQTVRSQYDSRNIRLSFFYRFGNSKLDVRKRNSGSEEEQRRNQ